MIKKKYKVLRSGILYLNGGEMAVSLKENSFGDEWFASEEQFQKQVDEGLIAPIESLPN